MIGFYDGFFGPGTGSFLILHFINWLGFYSSGSIWKTFELC